jgi:hypothetical protein
MKFGITLFITLTSLQIFAQNYWQQEVNYKINVKLNDKNHTLSAFEEFEYVNNSPDKLDILYIHIWPNAYKNGKTALAKQLYESGEKFLRFGNDSIKGNIDSLDFKVNGQKVRWEYHPKHIDICKIYLISSLNPGERINVSTPFKVKIPSGEISRLGHVGQSYQITQWYPKPAVYDKNGWNQMPYLTQGEFYSEYGSFDVSITLPKNYIVGATGDLQTESELVFLDDLAKKTKENLVGNPKIAGKFEKKSVFPESSLEWKTIRFTQSKVHDFAWFADKRFKVLKGEVELPHSKRKVTTWAMFTPRNEWLWKDAIEFINDGTYYYSLWNGDYPYNQVTAVDGTISAGGGMEYPNVTVIGNSSNKMELEIVIVHEVGHNWFYGILGSNERVHGWMDEGLNTLNEMRYIETKYPNNKQMSEMVMNGQFHLNDLNHHDMGDISYRFIAILGEDQPIETSSEKFTSGNYGIIMYQKTGLVFHYLKEYLGEELFDKTMQTYFETWKFKHPQPEDIRKSLENTSGKDLSWLFEDLIQTTNHLDYKIKRVKKSENGTRVSLKAKGKVLGPIPLSLITENDTITKWVETKSGKIQTVQFEQKNPKYLIIDINEKIPELNRSNNSWQNDKLFKKREKLTYEFFIGDHERNKNNHFWLPVIAANSGDKLMLGIASHNLGIPFKRFQYLVAPMFSFGRKNISGMGEFSYSFLPKSAIKLSKVGISIKSFGTDSRSYYAGVSPYLFMKLGNRKDSNPFSHNILIQGIYRYDERFTQISTPIVNFNPLHVINRAGAFINYSLVYKTPDFEILASTRTEYFDNLQNKESLLRSNVVGTFRFKYLKNKLSRWIELRAFIGKFWQLNNLSSNSNWVSNEYEYSLSGSSGFQDLFLEEYFFNRQFNLQNSQRMDNIGGFKSTNSFGSTHTWLTSANLYAQLPLKTNIFGLFADFGLFNDANQNTFVYNTGLAVRFGKVFGVYFPILMSDNFKMDIKYTQKIRFTLSANIVNKPLKINGLF